MQTPGAAAAKCIECSLVSSPAAVAAKYCVSNGSMVELNRPCSACALAANCGVSVAASSSSASRVLAATFAVNRHLPYNVLWQTCMNQDVRCSTLETCVVSGKNEQSLLTFLWVREGRLGPPLDTCTGLDTQSTAGASSLACTPN